MPGRRGLLLPSVVNKILPGIIWIIIIHLRDFLKLFSNFMRTRSPSLTFRKNYHGQTILQTYSQRLIG